MLISAKKSLEDEVKETILFISARKEEEETCMYALFLCITLSSPKNKKLCHLLTPPQVVPNLYEFLCFVEHKRLYFKE